MSLHRAILLVLVAPLVMAATRDRELNLQVLSGPTGSLFGPAISAARPQSALQPAPLPDRNAELAPPKESSAPTLAPTLFTRPNQYRGDGFSQGSTAQSEQERRVKPGAGVSFHLPLSPN